MVFAWEKGSAIIIITTITFRPPDNYGKRQGTLKSDSEWRGEMVNGSANSEQRTARRTLNPDIDMWLVAN